MIKKISKPESEEELPKELVQEQSKTSALRRRQERWKRVKQIAKYFGISSSGFGILTTVHFIIIGQWTAALISIFVSVSLVLLSIGSKFVQEVVENFLDRLEKKLEQVAPALADIAFNRVEKWTLLLWWRLTSNFQGKYYQNLIYTYRDDLIEGFAISPLVLPLEKVFIPLEVSAGTNPDNIMQSIVQNPNNHAQDAHTNLSIWKFLEKAAEDPTYRRIVVIGPPGSGKTTLLKHLTLTYVNSVRQRRKTPKLIPVLLYLRDIKDDITTEAETQPNLPSVITNLLNKQDKNQKSLTLNAKSSWFEEKLNRGKCLVMLDGLDEVGDKIQRTRVSQWVNQQMTLYSKTSFILTSRPKGYQDAPVANVRIVLQVKRLNLRQIKQFIQSWYLQTEIMSRAGNSDQGVQVEADKNADKLFERIIKNSSLEQMAGNPLLLSMIVTVHRYRGKLPGRRVELYAEIFNVLLGRRREAKGIEVTEIFEQQTLLQKNFILRVLSLQLMREETRQFDLKKGSSIIRNKLLDITEQLSAEGFIEGIEHNSGLIVQREQGIYEFAHQSLQEYLAAYQIKELNQEQLLIDNIDNSWWSETIRLYTALVDDATNIISAAFDKQDFPSLTLAFDCLETGANVKPDLRKRLENWLTSNLESTDSNLAKLASEIKLSRRLNNE